MESNRERAAGKGGPDRRVTFKGRGSGVGSYSVRLVGYGARPRFELVSGGERALTERIAEHPATDTGELAELLGTTTGTVRKVRLRLAKREAER